MFQKLNCEVLAIGPDSPAKFKEYCQQNNIPFAGLADRGSKVAEQYYQEVSVWKLGRMPATFLVNLEGKIFWFHYGHSMMDIPSTEELLQLVKSAS